VNHKDYYINHINVYKDKLEVYYDYVVTTIDNPSSNIKQYKPHHHTVVLYWTRGLSEEGYDIAYNKHDDGYVVRVSYKNFLREETCLTHPTHCVAQLVRWMREDNDKDLNYIHNQQRRCTCSICSYTNIGIAADVAEYNQWQSNKRNRVPER